MFGPLERNHTFNNRLVTFEIKGCHDGNVQSYGAKFTVRNLRLLESNISDRTNSQDITNSMDAGQRQKSPPPYEVVRSSCRAFRTARVAVDAEAAARFAEALDEPMVKEFGTNLALDANFTGSNCTFESVDSEAAFILLFHALDFGSGWRAPLHRHHEKGAFLTIKPGVENFFLSHPRLTSIELMACTKDEVAKHFAIDGNPELDDLAALLHAVIVELGTRTREYRSLTAFVKAKLEEGSVETPAGDMVWALIDTFPNTFDDCYTINDQTVCLYKKAQLVVGEMFHRFHREDPRFNFIDGNRLTAYIDNVICASMRYKKVIVPCAELFDQIENGQEIPKGSEDEVALRTAALVGIELVVSMTSLSSIELGNYLWGGLGKIPEVRKFQRHATKTVFY